MNKELINTEDSDKSVAAQERELSIAKNMEKLKIGPIDDSLEKYFKEFGKNKGFDTFLVEAAIPEIFAAAEITPGGIHSSRRIENCYGSTCLAAIFIANKEEMISDNNTIISESDFKKMCDSIPKKNGLTDLDFIHIYDYNLENVKSGYRGYGWV